VVPSVRLQRKVDLVLPAYGAPLRFVLGHSCASEFFLRMFVVAYQVARSAIPLMETALGRARELAPHDPVAAGLARYLERHIPEEMHHEEHGGAVLDDLAALGLDPDAVRVMPDTPHVASMLNAQRRWVVSDHPIAVLGLLELEAHQADRATVERLIEKTALPRAGFRQLLLHASLDVTHARELHRVLDTLPLAPVHENLIGLSALHMMSELAAAMIDALFDGSLAPRDVLGIGS
jgi:hypothetical protein